MGYLLQAVIGAAVGLENNRIDGAVLIPLPQGMALLPLSEPLRERFTIPFLEFGHTDEALRRVGDVAALFGTLKFAYVEAEFFGGVGGQAAAVWDGGKMVFGPCRADDAINQALVLLGVEKGAAHDEFDALGLGRHRDTENWKQRVD